MTVTVKSATARDPTSELFLINVSGKDRPGITANLTKVLADHNSTVLDIDQAVIHDNLTWGMLVGIVSPAAGDSLFKDLLFMAHQLDLDIRLTPVSLAEYATWVKKANINKHIVTLIGKRITAYHIAQIAELATQHNQNIETIKRISGRAVIDETMQSRPMAVELTLKGIDDNIDMLRADCLSLSQSAEVDIAVQKDGIYRRNRRLVCFDMDSTLIQDEAIDLMAAAAGAGEAVRAITAQAMNGEIDFKTSFTRRVAMLSGLSTAHLEHIAQNLTVTDGAERLIENLRRMGYRTAILSGGFNYFARRLQARLGIDYVYANDLEIVDEKLTGKVFGDIIDERQKARALHEIAAREGICLDQVIAVGDGANDIPMLSEAGLGIAFRAKPVVREKADYAMGHVGLDAILYLLGMREDEMII